MAERSKPWVMRTYSGHSSAVDVQRALPDQPGQGPDRPLDRLRPADPDRLRPRRRRRPPARSARSACRSPTSATCASSSTGIPLAEMNTSMTINATAAWLWALYLALAEEQGADSAPPAGHDAERHRQGVPEPRDLHLPPRAVAAADRRHDRLRRRARRRSGTRSTSAATTSRRPGRPRSRRSPTPWRPPSTCSTRCATRARSTRADCPRSSGGSPSSSTPGVRFVEEIAKMRAFTAMWDEICRTRYGVDGPGAAPVPLRRAGQLAGPDRAAAREQRRSASCSRCSGVTLSADARARAIQLPAWNEALGLPRPWDQQWSLRIQQVLAYETDLLEYADIFAGSQVMEAQGRRARRGRRSAELDDVLGPRRRLRRGRASSKSRLVASQTARVARIESGEQVVVGVNRFTETAASPLTSDASVAADPDRRPGGRARAGRRRRRVARAARRRAPSRPRSTSCAAWPPAPTRPTT